MKYLGTVTSVLLADADAHGPHDPALVRGQLAGSDIILNLTTTVADAPRVGDIVFAGWESAA